MELSHVAYFDVKDTLKIYVKAHGTKTSNLIININQDDSSWTLPDTCRLQDKGVENETELSFFVMKDYLVFKQHPQEMKW